MDDEPRVDHTLVRYLLILIGMALAAIIAAEAVSPGDSGGLITNIIAVVAPASAVLVLAIKGGEAVKSVKAGVQSVGRGVSAVQQETGEQSAKLATIEHAVNGVLGPRIRAEVDAALEDAINPRLTRLENALVRIERRLPNASPE